MSKSQRSIEYRSVLQTLHGGPMYAEDNRTLWAQLLGYSDAISEFYEKLGLEVYIDYEEEFACLKSVDLEGEEQKSARSLMVKHRLSRNATLLCALLREAHIEFENSAREDSMLILTRKMIRERMHPFCNLALDDLKFVNLVDQTIEQACKAKLLKRFGQDKKDDDQRYQVMRIIKARIPAEQLREVFDRLQGDQPEYENIDGEGDDDESTVEHA